MKKTFALLTITMILFSACQSTPEREIVIRKNEGVFEEALQALPRNADEQEASPTAAPKNTGSSGKWQAGYEKFDGKLKFTIDAEIINGEEPSYPVARIKPYYVPIEQANKIIEALYGTLDVPERTKEKTRDQIEEMIVQLELEIKECDKKNDAERYGLMKNDLKALQESLDTAPETVEGNNYSGEYDVHKNDVYEEWSITLRKDSLSFDMHMIIESPLGNGYASDIEFGDLAREYTVYSDENTGRTSFDENPVLTTDEAKAAIMVADEFLADIGVENRIINDMQMRIYANAPEGLNSYAIFYGKVFDGTDIPILSNYGGIVSLSEEEYTDIFMPERIMVEVRGDKIIGFEWYNAYETDGILNENIELMPFEEIMANAESQLAVKYANVNDSDLGANFYVDKIILSYAVQPIKDKTYEYMLVPAWSFYGGYDYGDGLNIGGAVKTGRYAFPYSLLTVNAVDGTVVSKN